MRLLIITLFLFTASAAHAQNDMGFIAPEGKILNYRTLTWNDFLGKENKEFADKLAEQNLQAKAYVSPAIYYKADSGEVQANGRVKFAFHVKCAFQSRAFVREATKEEHTNYVLIHEQDHYDIALTYSNMLQAQLSSRDYSEQNYSAEMDKVGDDLLAKYNTEQETYDHEVNPDGRDDKEKQSLWDARIKKGLENTTDEYYTANETTLQSVRGYGATVKRLPNEPALQFAVRARPLYTEFPQEMTSKVMETKEWGQPAVIAFYTQHYYTQDEDAAIPKDNTRTLACMFVPTVGDIYKRIIIDTFTVNGKAANIGPVFFANADSDQTKELIIMATCAQKDASGSGTLFMNRVYDNVTRPLPGKLKRLDDASAKIAGGLEGQTGGKPSKAKYKTEKEVIEALKKLGYN